MKISLIQFDIAWETPELNIQRIEELLHQQPAGDIIVLPEMWSTGFTMNHSGLTQSMEGPSVQKMKSWAEKHDSLVLGSLIIKADDKIYNRCIICHPDGKVQSYDKRHLFSFAKEDQHYHRGEETILIHYKGWKIMPQICYDLRFPCFSRYSDSCDYDLIIYMANWPSRRVMAWNSLLTARAIENQAYCIGVNRTGLDGNHVYYNGNSRAIDFAGKEIVSIPSGSSHEVFEISKEAIDQFRTKFPFLSDRDRD